MDKDKQDQTFTDEENDIWADDVADQNDDFFFDCLEISEIESNDVNEQTVSDHSKPISDIDDDNRENFLNDGYDDNRENFLNDGHQKGSALVHDVKENEQFASGQSVEADCSFNDEVINSPTCTENLDLDDFTNSPDKTNFSLKHLRSTPIQDLPEVNGKQLHKLDIIPEEKCLSDDEENRLNSEKDCHGKNKVCVLCNKHSISLSNCSCCYKELCLDCFENHTIARLTVSGTNTKKCHKKVDCELCKELGEVETAISWCNDCSSYLCHRCARLHQSMKITKSHSLYRVVIVEEKENMKCDWCAYMGEKDTISTNYCPVCEENLCLQCFKKHQIQKQTKHHIKPQVTATEKHTCNLCASNVIAESFCKVCDAYMCESCMRRHTKSDSHKDTFEQLSFAFSESLSIHLCAQCAYLHRETNASKYCLECGECLCNACEKQHLSYLGDHQLISVDDLKFCSLCSQKDIRNTTEKICLDCDSPLPLCADCCNVHMSLKPSRGHKLKMLRSDMLQTEVKGVEQTLMQ